MTLHALSSSSDHIFYLDTSYGILWAVFDKNGKVLVNQYLENQKASRTLHQNIAEICAKSELNIPQSFAYFCYSAGPGFYTGMRVSQVFSSILSLSTNIRCLNFYNYQLPLINGEKNYYWITKAYRGEVFVASCDETIITYRLYSQKDFLAESFDDKKVFFHQEQAVDQTIKNHVPHYLFTSSIVMGSPNLILALTKNSEKLDPFYFRPLEEEFKVSHV